MACYLVGAKPLSEPIVVSLATFSDAYLRRSAWMS